MNGSLRRLLPITYYVAALFVLAPLGDVIAGVWPPQPGDVQWRYGAVGVASNYLLSGLFGLALTSWTAAVAGHRRILQVCVVLSALGALVCFVACGSFLLDVLQLRGTVPDQQLWVFRTGAVKALLKTAATALGLLLLAVAGFRARREKRPQASRTKEGPLIVREG